MFSLIGQDLSGQRVLDAFGGSGLLGLEAWSRGARVVIVERQRRAVRTIQANVDALGASGDVEVLAGDVLTLAGGLGAFDGVLADPPYALERQPIVDALVPCATDWLLLEGDLSGPAPVGAGSLVMARERCYGGTRLWVFREGG